MRFHLLAASIGLMLSPTAFASDLTSICDDPGFEQVLHAAPHALPAGAVWLDREFIHWPRADGRKSFMLYYSSRGDLVPRQGDRIIGSDRAIFVPQFVDQPLPATLQARVDQLGQGVTLRVKREDRERVAALHTGQLVLVQENRAFATEGATRIQVAGALDDLYASAQHATDLGATVQGQQTRFKLWAPTAQRVQLCTYASGAGRAIGIDTLARDAQTGIWQLVKPANLQGHYYRYAVDVFVPGVGLVRNLVTDPYSVSLTTDSKRSYIAELSSPAFKPAGWDGHAVPQTVKHQTDMTVYELHVRDFSINDPSVPREKRGKYAAFTEPRSNGMRHLAALAKSGLTDVHLLPIFDIGSVPEQGCAVPTPSGGATSEAQQALVMKSAATDCFNWGYDPYHFNAPEGSYASDPSDGATRIREVRQMVLALHQAGLRVGMDVVYNHTFTGGQKRESVLDRIVPGYYHRLNAKGEIETSTCCDNTATEHTMMGKLMVDSVALWAREYGIDSFRFDLMGHQPRALMEQLQQRVNAAAGRRVALIGEGWNFGEVADGARFVQASQLSLNGSGIGTFSDRARDAVRGGGAGDSGQQLLGRQGFINGLAYDPNGVAGQAPLSALQQAADLVKVGLAGSVRRYPLTVHGGDVRLLEQIDYAGQPAGYASEPGEVVNYVENHDNQTLFDINAMKLPAATSSAERARVQMLGAAINAFSQGVAYFHAGVDTLRSKSLDRNSFNSGDWFNRLDWSYQTNYFGTGLPPAPDNGKDYPLLKPVLANPAIRPTPADIAFARDVFRDLLKVRASSTLFRLRTADDIVQRLRFFDTAGTPTLLAARIDGAGYPGANFAAVSYLINVDTVARSLSVAQMKGRVLRLHPAQVADARVKQARFDALTGTFVVPARTAVVFVE